MEGVTSAFPVLTTDYLVDVVSEWGVPVTEDDFLKPTAGVVQSIYCALLSHVLGIDVNDLEAPRQRLLTDLEFPEYYGEALILQMLLHHVGRLAKAAQLEPPTLQDLTRPDGPRTRKIISGLHNFMLFRAQSSDVVEKYQKRAQGVVEREAQLDYEMTQMQERLDKLKAERDAEKPSIEKEKAKLQEEQDEIKEMLKEIQQLQDANEGYKKEKSDLVAKLNDVQSEIQSVLRNIEDVKSRLVKSPERVRKQITEMAATTEQSRQTVASNESKSRALQGKLDQLAIIEQDVRSALDLMNAIEGEQARLDEALSRLTAMRSEKDSKLALSRELKGEAQLLETQMALAMDKLARAHALGDEKRRLATDKMQRLKSQYEEVALERKEKEKEQESLRREIEGMEQKIAEYIRVNQDEINTLLTESWDLRRRVQLYMETMSTKLGLAFSLDDDEEGEKKHRKRRKSKVR